MAELSAAEFYKAAMEAAGGPASEVLPTGRYKLKIKMVKPGTSKGGSGKFQVGVRFEVLESIDPTLVGKSTWINQTLTKVDKDGKPNLKAFGVFLKYMLQFGVPQAALDAGTPAEELSNYIVVGTEGFGDLDGDREFPVGTKRQDIKSFHITSVPTIGPGGMELPTAAPPVSVPVTVPVPIPVTLPQAQAAAPAVDSSEVAALKAQLAALQIPATPVTAPAVPF